MAVDTRNVFNPKSRPFTAFGNEYGVPPLHAPVDANFTNDGTSVISSSNPPSIMSPMSLSKSPSFPAMSPICTNWELKVPVGQMALATPGACCNPATRALAAVAVASSMPKAVADISGTDKKAKPAVRAVRTSPRTKLVFLSGSTRVIKDGIMRAAWELAKFRAKYQFVKKLFIAVSSSSVCLPWENGC